MIFCAEKQHGIYIIKNNKVFSVTDSLWHKRFGHLNSDYMKVMHNKSLVKGMEKVNFDSSNCLTCAKSKICEVPYVKKSNRSTKLLELIHSDVCGPMPVESIGGRRYFVTFIDDYSRYCKIYVMQSKNESYDKFVEFKNLVENQTGRNIKTLRTDNGTEYMNRVFEKSLRNWGIKHETSCTHSPAQNGMSERFNRTINDIARSLLMESGLSEPFWGEAVNTAVYIKNRSASKSLDKTPYEMFFKRVPSVAHFRTFGCRVVVLRKGERRLKFDAKGKDSIMVGYSEKQNGYCLYKRYKYL